MCEVVFHVLGSFWLETAMWSMMCCQNQGVLPLELLDLDSVQRFAAPGRQERSERRAFNAFTMFHDVSADCSAPQ